MPGAQEAFVLLEAAKRSGEERAQVLCRLGFSPQVVFHALRLYPDDADAQRDCLLDKLRAATSSSSAGTYSGSVFGAAYCALPEMS